MPKSHSSLVECVSAPITGEVHEHLGVSHMCDRCRCKGVCGRGFVHDVEAIDA